MTKQIPHGPDDLNCPLTLSAPLGPSKMSKTCHRCPLWVQLRGKNPNTGADVDSWQCSLASLPMLLIENAQQSRQNGAATESMRNEIVKRMDQPRPIDPAYQLATTAGPATPQLIDLTPRGNT